MLFFCSHVFDSPCGEMEDRSAVFCSHMFDSPMWGDEKLESAVYCRHVFDSACVETEDRSAVYCSHNNNSYIALYPVKFYKLAALYIKIR